MTAKFFAILTNQGAAKLANATSLGTKLNLTQMALGDANGVLPTPDAAQTQLINQKRIAPLNRLSVDPNNANQIIAEQVIPENEGGFWIREIGLYDDDGVLIAIANCPETYKPLLQEGSGRTQTIRMALIVSSTTAVTLKIDPSVVLATRQYADDLMNNHLKAANPHTQYAPLASPTFTGVPTVPDTHIGNYGQQIANTKFVHDVLIDDNYIMPVGGVVAWPQATPPLGWLTCNGAAFDKAKYPKLALAYPSGVLPDLRGEFIRGWDNGRGMDAGRTLLSAQADELRAHNHRFINEYATPTIRIVAFTDENSESVDGSVTPGKRAWTYIWMENTGGAETRPHNIAFNYIVRAA
ncbi:phage tail protein [Kosakonia pseudosacchari]|uniref:phage tail protein n=1 Tax=Kosakonia pseudosacchari TaxID=1646340 RepID=UPI0022F119EA|nr:phage tail protein [Kosakonia pseudosacchari]WBU50492.1 phage tail protein [Kosakonia pseudosacchari]